MTEKEKKALTKPTAIFIVDVDKSPPVDLFAAKTHVPHSIVNTRPIITIDLTNRNEIVHEGLFGVLSEHRRLVQAFTQPGGIVYGMIGEHDTADNWKIVPPFELVELKGSKLVVKLDPTDLLRDLDGNCSFQCYPWMVIVVAT